MGRACRCDTMRKDCSLENVSEMTIGKTYDDLEDGQNCPEVGSVWFTVSKYKFDYHVLGVFAELRKATISFVMSVCLSVRLSSWNNSAPIGRIFIKFDIGVYFENVQKIQV